MQILTTADPAAKAALTHDLAAAWRGGIVQGFGGARPAPPDRPARPDRPLLRPPREMAKRRRAGSQAGRVALLHALAHIELNAIDLAWDLVARFGHEGRPRAFFDDWVQVADDEADHFELLQARLRVLGSDYGQLPAHDGLWEASQATAGDLLARLAVVPMILEARGLDVTPTMIQSLRSAGDAASAAIVARIHEDEIGHVAAGCRWFRRLCSDSGMEPVATWRVLVRKHFKGELKPPFNLDSRQRAGFGPEFYHDQGI